MDMMDFNIPDDIIKGMTPETKGTKKSGYKVPEYLFQPKLTAENDNTYQAKVRFLYKPGSRAATIPVYRHYFTDMLPALQEGQKPKMWSTSGICRKTHGEKEFCPCCDSYWTARNAAKDGNPINVKRFETYFKQRNNTTKYLVNVLVIDDKTNPSNNGKVLLWEMTPSVYKMIQEAQFGKEKKTKVEDAFMEEDDDAQPTKTIVPFHPVEGCDFYLVIGKDDRGWTSYENSRFRKNKAGEYVASPIAETADGIRAITSQCHDFALVTQAENVASREDWDKKIADIDAKLFTAETVGKASIASRTTDGPGFDVPAEHLRKNVSKDEDFFASAPTGASDDAFDADGAFDDVPVAPAKSAPKKASFDDDDDLPF